MDDSIMDDSVFDDGASSDFAPVVKTVRVFTQPSCSDTKSHPLETQGACKSASNQKGHGFQTESCSQEGRSNYTQDAQGSRIKEETQAGVR
jgi:hypothetical protein